MSAIEVKGSLTYAEYVREMERRVKEMDPSTLEDQELERAKFTRLNLQRTRRIGRTYTVSSDLATAARGVTSPQVWMVITEPWCGDSAQNLPYIAAVADLNEQIEISILLRDDHLDVMDRYLTDGVRGIPKLVAFDGQGRELFRWGPRPREAAELFQQAKEAGLEKPRIMEQVHGWYAKNRGQALERELLALIAQS